MLALRDKSDRHMRLREQLLLHSKSSNLIVMWDALKENDTQSID